MEPYVVRENDYLLKIANKLGFDADTVWNDPSNDDLRSLRPDPNILLAGDVCYVPDQDDDDDASHDLTVGSTNSFTCPDAPTIKVSAKLVDTDPQKYASRAYSIEELEDLTDLATDGDGLLSFDAPLTLDTATIVFSDTGESLCLVIGGMDPIDTMIGVFKRLQNLGYIDWSVDFDADTAENNLDVMRVALRGLKASQEGGDDSGGDDDASDSDDDSESDDDSDEDDESDSESDEESDDSDEDDESDPESDDEDSDDDSDDSDDQDDEDDADGDDTDDAGLSDDGTLSDEMTSMLVDAHGY